MCNDDQDTIYRKMTSEWTLKVIEGFGIGEVFTLSDSQEYTIGRQNCDIIINQLDKKASRMHARLVLKKDQPFLENLSQTTTTYVNNSPIKKIKLQAGNKIGIGDTVFVLERTGVSQHESKITFKWIGIAACTFILMFVIFKVFWPRQPTHQNQTSVSKFATQPDQTLIPARSEKISESEPSAPISMPSVIIHPPISKNEGEKTDILHLPETEEGKSERLLPPPPKKPTPISKNEGENERLLPPLPKKPNTIIDKEKADELFRQGKIFYSSGNMKKAINLFESALSYNSDNPLVSEYLKKAKNGLDKKIDQLKIRADKSKTMLKYNQAKQALREIIELLSDNPQDTRYTDAQNKLRELENG
ncbi:FHA domain-containing protein [Desulfococcaceae bacterium HSG7]|nr:FHA domain-containing protein [Desulfococcaceae bacterium HSG7]